MEIVLKNKELVPVINFLTHLELSPKDSRQRSKFIKVLSEAQEELGVAEMELLESLGLLSEDKQLLPESERDPIAASNFNREQATLLEESVVINGGMFEKNIAEVQNILYNYEGLLADEEAIIYDRLLDEFEKNEGAAE